LGSGPITRSRKKKHITETETRITTAPYREAGVQDANTQLEQHAKQRMTYKLLVKLLSPKACVMKTSTTKHLHLDNGIQEFSLA